MSSDPFMKKVIGTIHLWLGLTSGLVVFIISITGCIYVFEEELKTFFYAGRETIAVPANATRKPLSDLLRVAERELGQTHPVQSMELAGAANRTYEFRPAQVRNDKAYTHFGEIVYQRKVYVNPYTGEVVKNENTKYEFFTLILRLHRNLLLNRETGTMIIGISVVIYVILLLSGLVLWWPKNKKSIRQRISFVWKEKTKWKRKNYDLHNVPGFYSLPVVLIIALTGLVWSFDWFDSTIQWIANGGVKAVKPVTSVSDTTKMKGAVPVDAILHTLRTLNPKAAVITINLPEKPAGMIVASVRNDSGLRYNATRCVFDQFTGELLVTTSFDDKNTGEKVRAMNYDIHTGSILRLPGKIIAFVASLISASLPVTGFVIWLGRRKKKAVEKRVLIARPDAREPMLQ